MDEDDKETVDRFYEEDGDNLVLKMIKSPKKQRELNDIFVKPMMMQLSLTSGSEKSQRQCLQRWEFRKEQTR